MQRLEVELDVALLGHLQRVLHRVGHLGEERLHLLRAAQIELRLDILHPLRVAEQRLRAEADETIVRVRMALLDVVNVIRRDALQAELLRPRDEMLVHLRLLGNGVILEFEIEIVRAKSLLKPINAIARLLQVILDDGLGNFARHAAGERDQALVMLREDFLVDARLVVIALQMRRRGELDQILVSLFILREQHEMIVNIATASAGVRLLFQPAARRDIDLAADDGLDAFLPRRLVEIHRAVKHAVIGDGDAGELQVVGLLHQLVEAAGRVEQAVLSVEMEMDKVRVRHRLNLVPRESAEQAGDIRKEF